jgi:hypothetical protein
MLLKEKGGTLRWFRHPFLQTGPTAETKKSFEEFLAARGYRVAPVTVDTNDWMYSSVYAEALARGDSEAAGRVREAYVVSYPTILDFFEDLTRRVFDRPIRHVLLVHANRLNADTLPEWAAVLRARGYAFVTLERAPVRLAERHLVAPPVALREDRGDAPEGGARPAAVRDGRVQGDREAARRPLRCVRRARSLSPRRRRPRPCPRAPAPASAPS